MELIQDLESIKNEIEDNLNKLSEIVDGNTCLESKQVGEYMYDSEIIICKYNGTLNKL